MKSILRRKEERKKGKKDVILLLDASSYRCTEVNERNRTSTSFLASKKGTFLESFGEKRRADKRRGNIYITGSFGLCSVRPLIAVRHQ